LDIFVVVSNVAALTFLAFQQFKSYIGYQMSVCLLNIKMSLDCTPIAGICGWPASGVKCWEIR